MNRVNEIAVFPIPDVVAFPGMVMPLHIFEPRYRRMAEEAEREDFDIGIALPLKTISKVNPEVLQKSFNQNMSSYEAHSIMSAGPLKILKKLEDGRLLVRIELRYRCKIETLTQVLPYYKADIIVFKDIEPELAVAKEMVLDILDLAGRILKKPIKVDGENISNQLVCATLKTIFNWTLSWVPLESYVKQELLELNSIENRCKRLLNEMKACLEVEKTPGLGGKPPIETKGNIIFIDFGQSAPRDLD